MPARGLGRGLGFPHRATRSRAGVWAFANYNFAARVTADNQDLWLSSNALNLLYLVDLDTHQAVRTLNLSPSASAAMGFVLADGFAYVAQESSGVANASVVSQVNLTSGVVTTIALATSAQQHCRGIALDATSVYVGCGSAGAENAHLGRISRTSPFTTTVLDLGISAEIWFAVIVVGGYCYLGLSTGQVVKVNLSTFSVAATVAASGTTDLRHVIQTGAKLYFSAYGADRVRGYDTSTDSWVESWATGSWPVGMALTPSGATLYVHETYNNQYRAIRVSDGTVLASAGQLFPASAQAGLGIPAMQPDGQFLHLHGQVGDKLTGKGYVNTIAVVYP